MASERAVLAEGDHVYSHSVGARGRLRVGGRSLREEVLRAEAQPARPQEADRGGERQAQLGDDQRQLLESGEPQSGSLRLATLTGGERDGSGFAKESPVAQFDGGESGGDRDGVVASGESDVLGCSEPDGGDGAAAGADPACSHSHDGGKRHSEDVAAGEPVREHAAWFVHQHAIHYVHQHADATWTVHQHASGLRVAHSTSVHASSLRAGIHRRTAVWLDAQSLCALVDAPQHARARDANSASCCE